MIRRFGLDRQKRHSSSCLCFDSVTDCISGKDIRGCEGGRLLLPRPGFSTRFDGAERLSSRFHHGGFRQADARVGSVHRTGRRSFERRSATRPDLEIDANANRLFRLTAFCHRATFKTKSLHKQNNIGMFEINSLKNKQTLKK
jgi:hypothetical protein